MREVQAKKNVHISYQMQFVLEEQTCTTLITRKIWHQIYTLLVFARCPAHPGRVMSQ
ncbi:hypothetical protein HMPREF0208_02259 [Citrobacter koseri]|uniref:Uncharacterized protein n=1 Tax=Citrobacter koseri (strain ATCC BAA-895 / CDC 4225-83 / SGSC4696) TaxID=290338 RepID=A8AGA8_CITK8|nr:hypothetical protein CKO_01385 [Citrobacter koseri ATCC BAA-895]KXA00438.1 hypothetical protein HMPREF3207_03547 [Citrobacter koseri]KXB44071.1 hypothetical protein HMPREF0208_02259 [Citrobacter koseri]